MFYVYALLDPRKPGHYVYEVGSKKIEFDYEPFYIGKGKGNRLHEHTNDVIFESVRPSTYRRKNIFKDNVIRKIIKAGLYTMTVHVSENLTEEKAFQRERLLIRSIGRRCFHKGPLSNLTDGGEGSVNKTPEALSKIEQANRKRWDSMTDEDREAFKQMRSDLAKEQFDNLTEDEYADWCSKLSKAQQQYWSSVSDACRSERTRLATEGIRRKMESNPEVFANKNAKIKAAALKQHQSMSDFERVVKKLKAMIGSLVHNRVADPDARTSVRQRLYQKLERYLSRSPDKIDTAYIKHRTLHYLEIQCI